MKKFLILFAAVAILLLGAHGQAMASFAAGDLIQIVYSTADSYEVATDLGGFSSTAAYTGSTITFNANPFPFPGNGAPLATGAFADSSWSNLNVAYFETAGNNQAWVSGPASGQSTPTAYSPSSSSSGFSAAANAVLTAYATAGGGSAQVQFLKSNAASYMSMMNPGGIIGTFSGLANANGETNLAALSSVGYVDTYLYYFSNANTAGQTGVQVADIRTFADGTSEIVGADATPVPPSVLLMGSGLIGLAGFRRKRQVKS